MGKPAARSSWIRAPNRRPAWCSNASNGVKPSGRSWRRARTVAVDGFMQHPRCSRGRDADVPGRQGPISTDTSHGVPASGRSDPWRAASTPRTRVDHLDRRAHLTAGRCCAIACGSTRPSFHSPRNDRDRRGTPSSQPHLRRVSRLRLRRLPLPRDFANTGVRMLWTPPRCRLDAIGNDDRRTEPRCRLGDVLSAIDPCLRVVDNGDR